MRIAKLYVFGNRASCSYCRALAAVIKSVKFASWLSAGKISVIDCDKTDKAAAGNYARFGKTVGYSGGSWPQVFIQSDAGKTVGSFVARNMTATTLIAKIKATCPECCEGAGCADEPAKTKTCPTCKGKGVVPA